MPPSRAASRTPGGNARRARPRADAARSPDGRARSDRRGTVRPRGEPRPARGAEAAGGRVGVGGRVVGARRRGRRTARRARGRASPRSPGRATPGGQRRGGQDVDLAHAGPPHHVAAPGRHRDRAREAGRAGRGRAERSTRGCTTAVTSGPSSRCRSRPARVRASGEHPADLLGPPVVGLVAGAKPSEVDLDPGHRRSVTPGGAARRVAAPPCGGTGPRRAVSATRGPGRGRWRSPRSPRRPGRTRRRRAPACPRTGGRARARATSGSRRTRRGPCTVTGRGMR